MELEGSTSNKKTKVVTKDTETVSRDDAGNALRPHTHWAQICSENHPPASTENLLEAMHYSIAKMLRKWPNPDLDPTHLITEGDYKSAILEAKSVHSAQPDKEGK
jgi:hypothetical protein